MIENVINNPNGISLESVKFGGNHNDQDQDQYNRQSAK